MNVSECFLWMKLKKIKWSWKFVFCLVNSNLNKKKSCVRSASLFWRFQRNKWKKCTAFGIQWKLAGEKTNLSDNWASSIHPLMNTVWHGWESPPEEVAGGLLSWYCCRFNPRIKRANNQLKTDNKSLCFSWHLDYTLGLQCGYLWMYTPADERGKDNTYLSGWCFISPVLYDGGFPPSIILQFMAPSTRFICNLTVRGR